MYNKDTGELDNEGSCYANEELTSVVENLFIRNPRSVSLFNKDNERVGLGILREVYRRIRCTHF